MHAGIGRMLEAGLAFPAHRYPRKRSHIKRIALESYPGFTARKITRGSYKSDSPAKQTPERKARRKMILDAVSVGEAGLAYGGMANCLRQAYRDGGMRALFRGAGARVMHFTPATCITMTFYEKCTSFYARLLS